MNDVKCAAYNRGLLFQQEAGGQGETEQFNRCAPEQCEHLQESRQIYKSTPETLLPK